MAETLAAEPRARWTTYQGYAVSLMLLANIFSALDRYSVSNLQEHIKRDLGLSDAQLGIIVGPAYSLFYLALAIPIARLAERTNRARLLAGVLTLWSGATALCGAATGFVSLILCRIGVGAGEGGCHPINQSTIADTFEPRSRGFAMSIYAAGPPIAAILAPVIAGTAAYYLGWRAAFAVIGLPGILLATLIWFTLKEPRHSPGARVTSPRPFFTDLRWAFGNRAFTCVFIGGAFNGIAISGTSAFTTSFIMRAHGFDIKAAGFVVGALGAMGFIGTFLGGWLADRFADARGRSYTNVCALGGVLSFVFFLLAFTQQWWPLVMLGLLGANLATDLKNGPNFAAIQNIVPSGMRATAAAIFTVASNVIGMGLGALLVGTVSDMAAAGYFTQGDFHTACVGGHGATGAAAALDAACKQASADGLRVALALVTSSFVGAALFYWLAGRKIAINTD